MQASEAIPEPLYPLPKSYEEARENHMEQMKWLLNSYMDGHRKMKDPLDVAAFYTLMVPVFQCFDALNSKLDRVLEQLEGRS